MRSSVVILNALLCILGVIAALSNFNGSVDAFSIGRFLGSLLVVTPSAVTIAAALWKESTAIKASIILNYCVIALFIGLIAMLFPSGLSLPHIIVISIFSMIFVANIFHLKQIKLETAS